MASIEKYWLKADDGEVYESHNFGGACTGVFQADVIHNLPILKKPIVEIKVQFRNTPTHPDVIEKLVHSLIEYEQVGNTFTFNVAGVPFDVFICCLRILRHLEKGGSYVQNSFQLHDYIILQAPMIGDISDGAYDSGLENEDEVLGDYLDDNRGYFSVDKQKARIISFTSGKKKTFNKPFMRPLGGPDGCRGYFKGYELAAYQGGYRDSDISELIQQIFDDNDVNEVHCSIDHILMCHGQAAERPAAKIQLEGPDNHTRFQNLYFSRVTEKKGG